jgi:hypothetical protein
MKALESGIHSVTVLRYIRTQANFYSYFPIVLDRYRLNSVEEIYMRASGGAVG